MKVLPEYRLPPEKEHELGRVIRLEWWSLGTRVSIIIVLYLTLGNSQAMKAAWLEDMMALIPPIAFLIAMRFRNRPPNPDFPYGYRRAGIIAFLCASVALTLVGFFLIYDSGLKLIKMDHPTIGGTKIFGETIWTGWIMIAGLIYSVIPPVIIGHLQEPAAQKVHEKTVFADAKMSKADWGTGLAAIVGILGVGLGWWWADAVAALVISASVTKDGVTNLKAAVGDLMDRYPRHTAKDQAEDTGDMLEKRLKQMHWVKDAAVRLREQGHVFLGEAFVVPISDENLTERLNAAADELSQSDWRIQQVVVTAVPEITR